MVNRRSSDGIIIEMNRTLGNIEGAIESIHDKVVKIDNKIDSHDNRIGILEDGHNRVIWGAAGFSAAISGVVAVFTWILR